jgi:hypothetical protein
MALDPYYSHDMNKHGAYSYHEIINHWSHRANGLCQSIWGLLLNLAIINNRYGLAIVNICMDKFPVFSFPFKAVGVF